jgi:hypothetical protein
MKSSLLNWTVIATMAALAGGCAVDMNNEAGVVEAPGPRENGLRLNGLRLNGTPLAGAVLTGVSMKSATIGNTSLGPLGLFATSLVGYDQNGIKYTGADLVLAEMTGTLKDGSTLPLRIDDIVQTQGDTEILRYWVRYWSGSGWSPLCGTDKEGNDIFAIPLSGTWDDTGAHKASTTELTFACDGAALAKCALTLGYKPWTSVEECHPQQGCAPVPVAEMHQACTRMLRADYCGDGVSHTQDGVLINVWDNFGIEVADPTPHGFALEADWTPNGARHIHHTRLGTDATQIYIEQHCLDRLFQVDQTPSTFSTLDGFSTPASVRMLLKNESALP